MRIIAIVVSNLLSCLEGAKPNPPGATPRDRNLISGSPKGDDPHGKHP
jgi:hypothetical protein